MTNSLTRTFITELKRQLAQDRRMARRLVEECYLGLPRDTVSAARALTSPDSPIICDRKGEFDHYGEIDEDQRLVHELLAA